MTYTDWHVGQVVSDGGGTATIEYLYPLGDFVKLRYRDGSTKLTLTARLYRL